MTNAEFVGYACFAIGAIVLILGVMTGLTTSVKANAEAAKRKIDEAQQELATAAQPGVSAAGATAQASSALDEAQEIISALPEHLRFAGLLIVIGTILIGVATVQFGGVSLF